MSFLSLPTIALLLIPAPSQVRFDAGNSPQLQAKRSAILAGTKPLSDDLPTTAVDVDASRPVMLAQAQQPHPPRMDKTIADAPDSARETNKSCLDPASIEGSAPGGLELAALLNSLGEKAWERGDLSKAAQCHRQALAIRQKLAPRSLDVAESYNNLGNVEQQLGDLAKAEKYERDALAIRQALAPNSLAVAETLHGPGRVNIDRGDLAKAEQYLQRSFDLRLKLAPGSRDLALSLIGLANLAARRGDLTKQEDYLHQALGLDEKLNPADRATIFQGLGAACLQRGDPEKAEEYFRQALAIRQELLPDSLPLAISLTEIGSLASNRGDPDQAENYFRQALEIRQRLAPGSLAVAASLSDVGSIVQVHGDLAQAERCFRQALTIRQRLAPGSLNTAGSLHQLGIVFWLRGDLERADRNLHQAAEIKQRLAPASPELAQTLNWLGLVASRRGDLDQAEKYDHQALDISEKVSPASLLDAEMLSNLGDIAKRREDVVQADKYYRQALDIHEKIAHDSPAESITLQKLGDLARKRRDFDDAEKYLRQALVIREKKVPGSLAHAGLLFDLASLQRQRHQDDDASQLYEQGISVLDSQMARLGGTDDVRSGFRASYESQYHDYIDLLISKKKPELAFNVAERSRARTLLELLESAQIDIGNGCDPRLLRQERSLRDSISAKSSYRLQLLDGVHTADQIAALDKHRDELRAQYEEVKTQLRVDSPAYASLAEPKPLSSQEAQQQLLDENTILLEYSLGERRSYVWAVTRTSLAAYALPPRKVIEGAARNVYELLTARGHRLDRETARQRKLRLAQAEMEYTKAAAALSQMVLGPVAPSLGNKRLLIVSDGALQYLPYAALPSPRLPVPVSKTALDASTESKNKLSPALVTQHEIVSLPSASALAELRRASMNRKKPPKAVAVLADPVFDPRDERVTASVDAIHQENLKTVAARTDELSLSAQRLTRSATDVGLMRNGKYLSRLLWTQLEAAAILSVTPSGQGVEALGFDANRATAVSPSLTQYRIVHFATHALLDSKNPELSGLVLSLVNKRGQPQNGFLDLEQIYNLKLPADLVVLSACDTGLGQEIRGEGLVGLSRGFMYAGASRVMASLWSVDDEVTSELMARFYKSLEQDKMSPAAALRAAQIEVAHLLGYPFVSQQPGTSELIQTYNPSTGHHSLRNSTGLETEKGYVDQPLGVYGYPRYYNLGAQLLSLTGGGVTLESNEVAGGSLWQWTWNGVQVINNWDYGRQIQTDIFPFDYANPTEAGDTWSNDPRPAVNHGSPLGLAENDGLTQRTRSVTLEYDPDGTQQCYFELPVGPCPGFGGGASNPVVWPDVMLGKDVTLDFQGLGPVALYSTFMQVPKPLASGTAREIPVIYARANFYRMFTYDAEAAQLQENPCSNGSIAISPNYGGVIATTGDEKTAIGIYAVNISQGGSVDYLVLNFTWSCPGPPADTGEFGGDTMIVDSVRYTGYPAGPTVTNTYVISGTLKSVVEKMDALYKLRDSIPR